MPEAVLLTLENQERAKEMAQRRFRKHGTRGTRQRYGHGPRNLQEELDSLGAEFATCQLLGLRWEGSDEPEYDGDGHPGIQTRWTRHASGRLLLHDDEPPDKDHHAFFLVTGTFPRYLVFDWIWGREGKRVGYRCELQPGRPAICVDQSQLPLLVERRDGMTQDLIFEAVCEVCGIDWREDITKDQRGRVNAAVKQLRDLYGEAEGAVPEMIRARADAWHVVYPEIPMTPQTLTGNWSTILNAAAAREEQSRNLAKRKAANAHARSGCQTCGDDHFVFVGQDADGNDLVAPCPDCNASLDPSYWVQRQRVQLMTGEQARKFLDT